MEKYILQVNIGIIVFWLLYRLFYSRDTFLRFRRFFLLALFALSFTYPLVTLDEWLTRQDVIPEMVVSYAEFFADQPITIVAEGPAEPVFTPGQVGWMLWGVGFVLLLMLFGSRVLTLLRMFVRGKKIYWKEIRLVALDQNTPPFSFFRWMFVNPVHYGEYELEEIIIHEKAHIDQWHSVDLVLSEIMSCVFWFNPVVWILRREIRQNLEFLADREVVASGVNRREYQYHLLNFSYQSAAVKIVNNFNVSQLKKRIIMMNKEKSSRLGLMRYALLVPVTGMLILSANAPAIARVADEAVETIVAQAKSGMMVTEVPDEKHKITIKGIVVDEAGKPLQGASVIIRNTSIGTFADGNGNFSITGDKGAVIEFSYVGRKRQQMVLDGVSDTKIRLEMDRPALQGVTVVGYVMDEETDPGNGENPGLKRNGEVVVSKMKTSDGDLNIPDRLPRFDNLSEYLAKNVRYPEIAAKHGIQGNVLVSFIVDETGKVNFPKIAKGVDPSLDKEALRVVSEMPDWTPAEREGKTVACGHAISVNFVLPKETKPDNSSVKVSHKKDVFVVVEDPPHFPDLAKYLAQHVKYPVIAQENGIEGKVYVQFEIDETGKVVSPKLVKSVDPSLDNEALRVVREMPDWTPGKQRGKAVRTSFTIPVTFMLSKKNGTASGATITTAPDMNKTVRITDPNPDPESPLSSYISEKDRETYRFIVDGKMQPKGTDVTTKLKMEDIQSIEVLKGEYATQLWGEDGKNGVMIITMKKDKK